MGRRLRFFVFKEPFRGFKVILKGTEQTQVAYGLVRSQQHHHATALNPGAKLTSSRKSQSLARILWK